MNSLRAVPIVDAEPRSIEGSAASDSALPAVSPIDALAARSRRLADVVSAISRRADVRNKRARLLSLLLSLRCPLQAAGLKARWYVRGAVARLSIDALRRAWKSFHGEEAPSAKTLRAHLGALERNLAIIREPGQFLPMLFDDHPERRPRWPDTIHVLDDERTAEWWASAGRALLEASPAARWNPREWRRAFGDWRRKADNPQAELSFPGPISRDTTAPDAVPARGDELETAGKLAALVRAAPGAITALRELRGLGVPIVGPAVNELARDRARLLGAAALLAFALARGDGIRNRPGWVVRAFRFAEPEELAGAARWAAEWTPRAAR
jgi:hypothetical protein